MKVHPLRLAALPLCAVLALAGCNSSDGSAAAPTPAPAIRTLTVTPSLGRIKNARVILHNAANRHAVPLAEQALVDGKAVFSIPASVSSVVVEVLPEAVGDVTYFDEALGRDVQVLMTPANRDAPLLRAAAGLSADSQQLGVTALTEVALRRAEALSGGAGSNLTLQQIADARAQVQSVFGVADISLPPTLVDELADLAGLGISDADQYALRLASLARIANAKLGVVEKNPALRMSQALANDVADDGRINGSGNGAADMPYDVATLATEYQAQALQMVLAFQSSAVQQGFDPAKLQLLAGFLQGAAPLGLSYNVGGGDGVVVIGCGLLPTLAVDALTPFVGDYRVEIKQDSGVPPNVESMLVKTTGLSLQVRALGPVLSTASVTLDGHVANVTSVCQNGSSRDNVLVNLDKGGALAFFSLIAGQKTTHGFDYTAPIGPFRHFTSVPAQGVAVTR